MSLFSLYRLEVGTTFATKIKVCTQRLNKKTENIIHYLNISTLVGIALKSRHQDVTRCLQQIQQIN